MIEWMRAFNKAPGDHPILTFTSFDMQTGIAAAAMALGYLRKVSPEDAAKAEAPLNAAAAPDGLLLPDPSAAKLDAEQVALVIRVFGRRPPSRSSAFPVSGCAGVCALLHVRTVLEQLASVYRVLCQIH